MVTTSNAHADQRINEQLIVRLVSTERKNYCYYHSLFLSFDRGESFHISTILVRLKTFSCYKLFCLVICPCAVRICISRRSHFRVFQFRFRHFLKNSPCIGSHYFSLYYICFSVELCACSREMTDSENRQ